MQQSGLARKTLGLLTAGTLTLVVIVVLTLVLVSSFRNAMEIVGQERQVRRAASEIRLALSDAESAQRGYLLTRREPYLQPYYGARQRVRDGIASLRATIDAAGADERTAITKIDEMVEAKLAELDETLRLAHQGNFDAALAIVNSDRGSRLMDAARAELRGLSERSEAVVVENIAASDRAGDRLIWISTIGGLAILAFAMLAYLIVADNTKRLRAARNEVETLNRSLEERVQERTAELQRSNDEIQRFAYVVSHDLRAPLVNVMGFTSELETAAATLARYFASDDASPEVADAARTSATVDIPESVGFIRSSTTKMDGLIAAILKLSREGRRDLVRERVPLADLIAANIATLTHQIDTSGAQVELPDAMPSVVGDRTALSQVFGNLLDNAIKYLDPKRPGQIRITAEETGGRVRVRIADNGRGIEEKDLERIFELFRRAGRQDRPGDGVGLAHVRALVRRMGGDVTVASRYGEGTTFEVDLPKKAAIKPKDAKT